MRITRFARGQTSSFGKIGPILGQLRVADRTIDPLKREATRAGMPVMEFVRHLIEMRVHGRQNVEREIRLRLDLVDTGNVSDTKEKARE